MVTRAGTWALVGLLVAASSAWGQVGVQDDPERLAVRGESLTVVLSKAQQGAISSLVDHASQREFAAPQAEPCLFRLGFTKVGDGVLVFKPLIPVSWVPVRRGSRFHWQALRA